MVKTLLERKYASLRSLKVVGMGAGFNFWISTWSWDKSRTGELL